MSRTFRNGNFKVHYREYLTHRDEPKNETPYDGTELEPDPGLIRSSYYEKRRFRRAAKRLRRYAI